MKNRSACFKERERLLKMGPLPDIKELVHRAALLNGDKPVLSEMRNGSMYTYSSVNIMDDVNALGTALIDLGLEGRNIALLGENSYSWIVCYLAVVCGTGTVVPIDRELTAEDICRLLKSADCEAILFSGAYLGIIENSVRDSGMIKTCISFNGSGDSEQGLTVDSLIKRGKTLLENGDSRFTGKEIDPLKTAVILLTSGTTGPNKGVVLSHRNICTNINALAEVMPNEPTSFSLLPFHHSFECNCHILPCIYAGCHVFICSSLKRLLAEMRMFKPGMTVVVPLFLDTIYRTIRAEAKKTGAEKKLKTAIRISNALLRLGIDLRRKIFRQICDMLGGNLSLIVCGGAPADPEVLKGIYAIGIDVVNGYGLTECSPIVTINLKTHKNPASVGPPVPYTRIRIDDPDESGLGEVLVSGDNVMCGYYNDEAATAATFSDGWLRTGDYGKIVGGSLMLTGRKKNIIILENGKNVHPEEIEEKIISHLPYVNEVVVYPAVLMVTGIPQDVIVADLHIDPEASFSGASTEEIHKLVAEDLRKVNKRLPLFKNVHCMLLSQEDFPRSHAMKILRHKLIENNAGKALIKL